MKAHWDNIAAETARDSKRSGSEDQSDISVYSDLAGNIFNDLPLNNDDDGNHNDDAGMSVRITIEEEENEDEDGKIACADDDDEEEEEGEEDDVDDDELGKDEDVDDDCDDIDENEVDEDDENDDNEEEGEDDDDDDEDEDEDGELAEEIDSADEPTNRLVMHRNPDDSAETDDPDTGYDEYDEPDDMHHLEENQLQDLDDQVLKSSWKSNVGSIAATTAASESMICCNGACHWKSYYPIFIASISLLDWLFFLGGIVAIRPPPKINLMGPLSPALPTFPFKTIGSWPGCSEDQQHWRLISSQFTHEGLQHIGGYTALGLIYGMILEVSHPYHSFVTAIVYQASVIFGCMGHSVISPYEGFIGCSSGVYGLIGCCFSHFMLTRNDLDWKYYYAMVFIFIAQALFEIVAYAIWYSPDTAYAAHFASFSVGLFIGMSFGISDPRSWKKITGAVGICSFSLLSIFLIVYYSRNTLNQLSTERFSGNSCCKHHQSHISTDDTAGNMTLTGFDSSACSTNFRMKR